MNENNKSRINLNDLNNSNIDEKQSKEYKVKKKRFEIYKFHMLHHNGLLETLKNNGNINIVNNTFNRNEGIFSESMKNNEENNKQYFKKSFSEISIHNYKKLTNKNDSKINLNDRSIYDNIVRNNNGNMNIKSIMVIF